MKKFFIFVLVSLFASSVFGISNITAGSWFLKGDTGTVCDTTGLYFKDGQYKYSKTYSRLEWDDGGARINSCKTKDIGSWGINIFNGGLNSGYFLSNLGLYSLESGVGLDFGLLLTYIIQGILFIIIWYGILYLLYKNLLIIKTKINKYVIFLIILIIFLLQGILGQILPSLFAGCTVIKYTLFNIPLIITVIFIISFAIVWIDKGTPFKKIAPPFLIFLPLLVFGGIFDQFSDNGRLRNFGLLNYIDIFWGAFALFVLLFVPWYYRNNFKALLINRDGRFQFLTYMLLFLFLIFSFFPTYISTCGGVPFYF